MVYELKKPDLEDEGDKAVIEGTEGIGIDQPEIVGKAKTIEGGSGATQQPIAPIKAPAATEGAGGVTDVGKYLDVNREQAQRLAGKIGGVIGEDINKANTGFDTSQTRFGEDVTAGTVAKDEDLYNQARGLLTDPYASAGTKPVPFGEPTPAPALQSPGLVTPPPLEAPLDQTPPTTGLPDGTQPFVPDPNLENPNDNTIWRTPETGLPDGTQPFVPDPNLENPNDNTIWRTPETGFLDGTQPFVPDPNLENPADNQISLADFLANQGEAFKAQYGAQYGGPRDIFGQDYYQEARTAKDQALKAAGNINTAEGREALIRRVSQTPSGRYGAGVAALDQALLSQDEESFKLMQEAANPAQELEAKMLALETLAAEKVAQGMDITQATREAYAEEFDISREEGEIGEAYKQIRDEAKAAAAAEKERVKGMTKEEGVDPLLFFNDAQLAGLNKYQVAGQGDFDRLKALESLTGRANTFSPYEEQVGSYGNVVDPTRFFDEDTYKAAVGTSRDSRLQIEAAEKKAADEAEAAKKKAVATGIGAAVGAVAGSYFGPVGTVVGAVIGGAIGGLFCFEGDTLVMMSDGSTKMIKDIKINDILSVGGRVTSVMNNALDGEICRYDTLQGSVYVTGTHAVCEDGKWLRVIDSKNSQSIPRTEKEVNETYSLSCVNHRIIISGQVFSDYQEVDNNHLFSDRECLDILNGKGIRTHEQISQVFAREGRLSLL